MRSTSQASTERPHLPVYYLDGDTDRDMHESACYCSEAHPLPHRAIGASLYALDLQGAQAWHALRTGTDTESFPDWCQQQEKHATYYGVDNEAAKQAALQQARKDGWLILNAPKPERTTFPTGYHDSRANYQDIPLYHHYHREPDNEPRLVYDEAPFPLWIVPPGYRMARLSCIVNATGYQLPPQEAGALLTLAGVIYAPSLHLFGLKEALLTWKVEKTGDHLVFWRVAKV